MAQPGDKPQAPCPVLHNLYPFCFVRFLCALNFRRRSNALPYRDVLPYQGTETSLQLEYNNFLRNDAACRRLLSHYFKKQFVLLQCRVHSMGIFTNHKYTCREINTFQPMLRFSSLKTLIFHWVNHCDLVTFCFPWQRICSAVVINSRAVQIHLFCAPGCLIRMSEL